MKYLSLDPLLNQLYDQCMEGAIDATTVTDYLQAISTGSATHEVIIEPY